MNKKYLAELIGTFGLAFAVYMASMGSVSLGVPMLAALVVGLFVYKVGPISGSHLNPAVTLGALWMKKIKQDDAVGYLVAQFVGAGLALAAGSALVGTPAVAPFAGFDYMLALAEAAGAGILTFGISSVMLGKTPDSAAGLVIGGSLLAGITVAGLIAPGAGILNPAVALALRAFDLTHVVGPIAGAAGGMWLYKQIA